jgi:hypothetical protein
VREGRPIRTKDLPDELQRYRSFRSSKSNKHPLAKKMSPTFRLRHAKAAWTRYVWLLDKVPNSDPNVKSYVHAYVQDQLGKNAFKDAFEAESADEVFWKVTRSVAHYVPHGKTTLSRKVVPTNFKIEKADLNAAGVTTFQAWIEHHDRKETVGEIAKEADPQSWSRVFPDTFVRAHRILNAKVPERFAEPDSYESQIGEPWGTAGGPAPFYENAQLTFGGATLASFRTLLNMSFDVHETTPKEGEVMIEYSLNEALSNTVLCLTRAGGPDVDHAEKGTCKVTLQGGKVTTSAAKTVRSSDDVPFADEFNLLALPFWATWITDILVKSTSK